MAASAKLQLLIDISNKLYNSKLSKMQRKFNKTMHKMKANMRDFTSEIPGMGRALDILTNKWVLMGIGVAGIGLLLNKSVKSAAAFDSEFLHIRQLNLDKPKAELESYRNKIRDIAFDTGTNLQSATKAMYDLQSATGVYGDDAIMIYKKVANYSVATGADVNDAMNSTTKAMKALQFL